MYPLLAELGPLSIYTYGVLLAAAYLAGLQMALVRARARGIDATRVMDLGIYIIIAALVGAKLLLLVVDFEYFSRHPAELLALFRSGGVFYGGLLLAAAVAIWHMRRHRLPLWTTADAFAPGIALGHVIGRLGCFFAGCCYGRPTDVAWAVTFTDPLAAANVGTPLGVPLHPVQLYEAGAELVILGLLLWSEKKGRPFPGRTFWGYVLVYAVSRFVLELYRGDPRGEVLGLMSTSQFISVLLVPAAVVMLTRLARRPEGGETATAPASKKAARRG